MPSRALIVDDHPIIRDALVTSLVSLGVFDMVETAASFQELLKKLERDDDYQLLILDLSLTDVTGAEGMLYIREHSFASMVLHMRLWKIHQCISVAFCNLQISTTP